MQRRHLRDFDGARNGRVVYDVFGGLAKFDADVDHGFQPTSH